MLTFILLSISTLLTITWCNYQFEHLFFLAVSCWFATIVVGIAETVMLWHNKRVQKDDELYQRRLDEIKRRIL